MSRFAAVQSALPAILLVLAVGAQPLLGVEPKGEAQEPTTFEARGQVLSWRPHVGYERLVVTLSGSGAHIDRAFLPGEKLMLDLSKEDLPDGAYTWELRVVPVVSPELRERMEAMREARDRQEVSPAKIEGLPTGRFVQTGHFALRNGVLATPDEREPEPKPRAPEPQRLPGDLEIAGDLTVRGAKRFAVTDPEDASRTIVYAALEGPEVGTYYRGSARIEGGSAIIELPEHFAKTTEADGLTVQLTPLDGWALLYVAEKSSSRIVVKQAGGEDGAHFDFLVQGIRRGYAGFNAVPPAANDQGEPNDPR